VPFQIVQQQIQQIQQIIQILLHDDEVDDEALAVLFLEYLRQKKKFLPI
jgi:hypothetical protein